MKITEERYREFWNELEMLIKCWQSNTNDQLNKCIMELQRAIRRYNPGPTKEELRAIWEELAEIERKNPGLAKSGPLLDIKRAEVDEGNWEGFGPQY